MPLDSEVKDKLKLLYPDNYLDVFRKLKNKFGVESVKTVPERERAAGSLTEKDVFLITYGDSVSCAGKSPLLCLAQFLNTFSQEVFSSVHILPCFPYSSDDGFSVIDYRRINPDLGGWEDIISLSQHHDIMLDAVLNHVSSQSLWFRQYLAGEDKYQNYFIEADQEEDYSKVVRPRTLPFLTPFLTNSGKKHLWTTFSDDQIDLNYANPEVLLEILDVLVSYARTAARFIRLDAIGFIWKKAGTSCVHLPETHALIQIMRLVLDEVVPGTLLITETNVPHLENISYFGDGSNEAHLVYQFPLPPLVLHSFITGEATALVNWIETLEQPLRTAYFNFLSSHDGIGIRPAEGLLSREEIGKLVQSTVARGGQVSYKKDENGLESPYELNITFREAICHPEADLDQKVDAMIAAHSILLALQGVPALYFNSYIGGGNDYQEVLASGIKRRINRRKYNWHTLEAKLKDKGSLNYRIWKGLAKMIRVRRGTTLFSPSATQEAVYLHPSLFVLKRCQQSRHITCITNVSNQTVALEKALKGFDIISDKEINQTTLHPYQVLWLKKSCGG